MTESMARCNMLIFQDSGERCELDQGHDGDHGFLPRTPKLTIQPHRRQTTEYVEDPNYREIDRGDGMILVVPLWVADAVERGWPTEQPKTVIEPPVNKHNHPVGASCPIWCPENPYF